MRIRGPSDTDSVTRGLAQPSIQRHDGAVTRTHRTERPPPEARLDDVAKQIIELLQEDGRQSYAAIAKTVGLSEAAVRQRVQRMLEAGVMLITTRIRTLRGVTTTETFVYLKLNKQHYNWGTR